MITKNLILLIPLILSFETSSVAASVDFANVESCAAKFSRSGTNENLIEAYQLLESSLPKTPIQILTQKGIKRVSGAENFMEVFEARNGRLPRSKPGKLPATGWNAKQKKEIAAYSWMLANFEDELALAGFPADIRKKIQKWARAKVKKLPGYRKFMMIFNIRGGELPRSSPGSGEFKSWSLAEQSEWYSYHWMRRNAEDEGELAKLSAEARKMVKEWVLTKKQRLSGEENFIAVFNANGGKLPKPSRSKDPIKNVNVDEKNEPALSEPAAYQWMGKYAENEDVLAGLPSEAREQILELVIEKNKKSSGAENFMAFFNDNDGELPKSNSRARLLKKPIRSINTEEIEPVANESGAYQWMLKYAENETELAKLSPVAREKIREWFNKNSKKLSGSENFMKVFEALGGELPRATPGIADVKSWTSDQIDEHRAYKWWRANLRNKKAMAQLTEQALKKMKEEETVQ